MVLRAPGSTVKPGPLSCDFWRAETWSPMDWGRVGGFFGGDDSYRAWGTWAWEPWRERPDHSHKFYILPTLEVLWPQ